jgi:ATP-dependent Clp protease ATP-binding subunit ClpA
MEIDNSLFSQKAQAIAQQTYEVTLHCHHNVIVREHVLLACLGTANDDIINLLERLNVNIFDLKKSLEILVNSGMPPVPEKELQLNRIKVTYQVRRFIERSRIEADRLGEKIISSEILFLTLVQSFFSGPDVDRKIREILTSFGVTPELIMRALLSRLYADGFF